MSDYLYALATKVKRLEAIQKKYHELPEDPQDIVKFLRFAYENPIAFFPQTRKQRRAAAKRIFEQAKNLKELPEKNLAELVQTMRDHGKRPQLYSGIVEVAECNHLNEIQLIQPLFSRQKQSLKNAMRN